MRESGMKVGIMAIGGGVRREDGMGRGRMETHVEGGGGGISNI